MVEGGINIEIKCMFLLIKVWGLDTKEYNACEYVIIFIYVFNIDESKVVLIY